MGNKFTKVTSNDFPDKKYYLMDSNMALYVCGLNNIYTNETNCSKHMNCKCNDNNFVKHCYSSFVPNLNKILEYVKDGKTSDDDFLSCFNVSSEINCESDKNTVNYWSSDENNNHDVNVVYIDKDRYKKYLEEIENKTNIDIDYEIRNFETNYFRYLSFNKFREYIDDNKDPIQEYKTFISKIMKYQHKKSGAPYFESDNDIFKSNNIVFASVLNTKEPGKQLFMMNNEFLFVFCDKSNNKIYEPIMNAILDEPNKSYNNIYNYTNDLTDKFFCNGNDYNLIKQGGKYNIVSFDIETYIKDSNSNYNIENAYNKLMNDYLTKIYNITDLKSKLDYQEYYAKYLIYLHYNHKKPEIDYEEVPTNPYELQDYFNQPDSTSLTELDSVQEPFPNPAPQPIPGIPFEPPIIPNIYPPEEPEKQYSFIPDDTSTTNMEPELGGDDDVNINIDSNKDVNIVFEEFTDTNFIVPLKTKEQLEEEKKNVNIKLKPNQMITITYEDKVEEFKNKFNSENNISSIYFTSIILLFILILMFIISKK